MSIRKHRHDLQAVAVSNPAGQTLILFQCEPMHGPACVQVRTVPGNWSAHDLDIIPRNWPEEIASDPDQEPVAAHP